MSKNLTRADDVFELMLFDMIDGDGMLYKDAGAQLGLTKNAVAGRVMRMRHDLEKAGPCICRKKENKDGGMGRGWWK